MNDNNEINSYLTDNSNNVNNTINRQINTIPNNDNNKPKFCHDCGNPLNINGECDYCSVISDVDKENEANKSKALLYMIISIVNIAVIFPGEFMWSILWLLFGRLSGEDVFTYLVILSIGCGYILASLIALIAFIINKTKNGAMTNKAFKSTFIGFIIGFLSSFIIMGFLLTLNV